MHDIAEEPVIVGLPADHPLAALERVPLSALAGETFHQLAGPRSTSTSTTS